MQKFVPPTIQINNGNWRNMNFEACGLNEVRFSLVNHFSDRSIHLQRLRFYRYEKGEVFLPHYDGFFPAVNSIINSFLAAILVRMDPKCHFIPLSYIFLMASKVDAPLFSKMEMKENVILFSLFLDQP